MHVNKNYFRLFFLITIKFFQTNPDTDPVLIWFQGGRGMPTTKAIFLYNGPFSVNNNDGKLNFREYSFITNHSVIYIDNPISAGFSFTEDDSGYPTSREDYGRDILSFLVQFFQIFSDFRKNDFFIGGDSYGGRYSLVAAREVKNCNLRNDCSINLKGIFIGNPLIDFTYQSICSDYLYELGLVDEHQQSKMKSAEEEQIEWRKLYYSNNQTVLEWARENLPSPTEAPSCIKLVPRFTGLNWISNVLKDDSDMYDDGKWIDWVEKPETRRALHVGNLFFTHPESAILVKKLGIDLGMSAGPIFTDLVESHRVLLFNGQLDMIFPYQSTINLIKSLRWTGSEEFKNAVRNIWYVDGKVAGYWRAAGKLLEVLVRKAGHVVTYDQLPWACKLLSSFTRNDTL